MPQRQQSTRSSSPRREQDLGVVDGLVQLSFLIQEAIGQVAAVHDLSIVQGRMLGILRDRELGMRELARLLNLEKSSLTGLVDRAERRGLVQRTATPDDRRAVHVLLTDEGHRLARLAGAEVAQRIDALVAVLPVAERKRLSRLASRVVLDDAAARQLTLETTSISPSR